MSFPLRALALLLPLLLALPAAAETRYISDVLRVPLRKSPCGSCAIIHSGLKSGTQLQLLDTRDEWAQVETPGGERGWLPHQYLTQEPVAREQLDAARANAEYLGDENEKLQAQLAELREENEELAKQVAQLERRKSELETEVSNIRKVSGNALSLQEQNEELVKRNRMLQSEIDVLTATRDQLQRDKSQRWFLYGGLAVFLGAILAMLLPRLKPRRKFSEWA